MSKVKIEGHGTGTGTFTVTTPSSNTDRTITLPDGTGTLIADNGSGKVGIGVTNPAVTLELAGGGGAIRLPSGGELQFADSANKIYGHSSNNYLRFDTNSTERMRVTDNGLTFNGDTAAANALDDYEEGTWTPALTGDSTAGNTSYTSAATQGIYTKVGRLVTASFTISLTAKGTISGNILINLPFTPTGFVSGQMHGQSGFCSQVKNMSTTTQGVTWRVRHDAASAYMQPIKSGTSPADSYGTHSDLSDTTKLVGTLTYASN